MAYEVTPGYSGTIVTKPTVTRRSGRILKGCIGAQVGLYISTLLLWTLNLIHTYCRPLRAISRQLLTRRASAVVSPGSRATSASARRRLLMGPLFLDATAAATSSRAVRHAWFRSEGRPLTLAFPLLPRNEISRLGTERETNSYDFSII